MTNEMRLRPEAKSMIVTFGNEYPIIETIHKILPTNKKRLGLMRFPRLFVLYMVWNHAIYRWMCISLWILQCIRCKWWRLYDTVWWYMRVSLLMTCICRGNRVYVSVNANFHGLYSCDPVPVSRGRTVIFDIVVYRCVYYNGMDDAE